MRRAASKTVRLRAATQEARARPRACCVALLLKHRARIASMHERPKQEGTPSGSTSDGAKASRRLTENMLGYLFGDHLYATHGCQDGQRPLRRVASHASPWLPTEIYHVILGFLRSADAPVSVV